MNGPEHYREAERLLSVGEGSRSGAHIVAAAQVHATLALAAALQPSGRAWADATRYDKAAGE